MDTIVLPTELLIVLLDLGQLPLLKGEFEVAAHGLDGVLFFFGLGVGDGVIVRFCYVL